VEFIAHQVNITRSQSTLNLLCVKRVGEKALSDADSKIRNFHLGEEIDSFSLTGDLVHPLESTIVAFLFIKNQAFLHSSEERPP
jgi:hypothetical protein